MFREQKRNIYNESVVNILPCIYNSLFPQPYKLIYEYAIWEYMHFSFQFKVGVFALNLRASGLHTSVNPSYLLVYLKTYCTKIAPLFLAHEHSFE